MAIQYYMRAYNTSLETYVDWVVNDTPDTLGTYSGYSTGDLINIAVNRVVQSKVDNWLQPDQGFINSDGTFFHLNSFDWIHASPPTITVINPPTSYVGIAVARGGTTNSQGELPPGAGRNYFSTLLWDEAAGRWKFVRNTNGDHTTLGVYQPVNMGDLTISGSVNTDGYVAIGTTPALSGALRLTNNQWIESRKAAGSADGYLIRLDNVDRVQIGTAAESPVVYVPGNLRVDGYMRDGATTPSTTGFLRNGNNTVIITARDTATTDLNLLATNASNQLLIGNAAATFSNILYNTSTNAIHQFQTNTATMLEVGTTNAGASSNNPGNFVRFANNITAPFIYQSSIGSGSGQTLRVQAQSVTAGTGAGGILALSAGSAPSGGNGGSIELYAGGVGSFPVASVLKMAIHPTVAVTAANNNSIQIFENLIRIDSAQTAPIYRQDTTAGASGQPYTVQAQNASTTGGDLVLTSGTGSTGANAGNVNVQTGGVTRVQITPTQTAIFGNLLVGGTVTSIASTVVELADRVIHVNSSANTPIGTPVAVPTLITGFSVDRGQTGGVKRDYYGLFWHEPDQYWKFAINSDGYTSEAALTNNLPTMASYYLVQPTAALTASAVPTAGGFRALNNTTAVSSRNQAGTQDLLLLGTDNTNRIIHGAGTNNAGHLFNTTTGTIYDFQVNSVSTHTLTLQSAGTTTHSHASTVTSVVYNQADTVSATGAPTTLQSQNAATTGGELRLTSGTGTTAGNVVVQTGGVARLTVTPTNSQFADAATALTVTPNSTGNTNLLVTSTATGFTLSQTATSAAAGAFWQMISQSTSLDASTGGTLSLVAGNATGTTGTGGSLDLRVGTGNTAAGTLNFRHGATTFAQWRGISASSATLSWITGFTARLMQSDNTTNSATGSTFTIQAQNATGTTSTGAALALTSGTGTSAHGAVNLQVGGVTTASVVTNKFAYNKGLRRNITTITTTYAVLATDDYIAVTTLAAPFTITLPSGATVGDSYEIKDATGNAGTNTLTVDGNGANIDGASTFAMTQPYASATFTFLNGQWSVS